MLDTTKFSHEFRTPLHHILGFLSLVLDAPDLSSQHRCHLQQVYDAALLLMDKINQHLGIQGKSSGYQQEYVSNEDINMNMGVDIGIILDTTNIREHIPSTTTSPSPSSSSAPSPSPSPSNIPNFPFETISCPPPSRSKSMSPIKSRSTSASPSPSPSLSPSHSSSPSISSSQRGLIRRTSFNVDPIPTHLQPIRILAADDTMGNCKLLAQFCLKLDIDIEFAANGQECYDKFITRQSQSYDGCEDVTWNYESTVFGSVLKGAPTLIIMDLDMPIVNGVTSARMIREYEQQHHLPHTPIISLSATTCEGEEVEGMDASLCKPISITTFRDSIVKWAEHVHRTTPTISTFAFASHPLQVESSPSKITLPSLSFYPSQRHRRICTTTSCIDAKSTSSSSSSSIPTYSHDTCSILQFQSRPKVVTSTPLLTSLSTTQLLSSTSHIQHIHSNHSLYSRHNVGI